MLQSLASHHILQAQVEMVHELTLNAENVSFTSSKDAFGGARQYFFSLTTSQPQLVQVRRRRQHPTNKPAYDHKDELLSCPFNVAHDASLCPDSGDKPSSTAPHDADGCFFRSDHAQIPHNMTIASAVALMEPCRATAHSFGLMTPEPQSSTLSQHMVHRARETQECLIDCASGFTKQLLN
jgi:hypothetical protein